MADQATVSGRVGPASNGKSEPSNHGHGNGKGVVGNIADFGNDVFTLVELQAKLAAADLSEAKARLKISLIVAVVLVLLGLGAIPVALFGIADLLATALAIRLGAALLLTAITVMVLSGLALFFVRPRLVGSFEPLRRSREELVRNIDWVRTVVVHSGREFPRRK